MKSVHFVTKTVLISQVCVVFPYHAKNAPYHATFLLPMIQDVAPQTPRQTEKVAQIQTARQILLSHRPPSKGKKQTTPYLSDRGKLHNMLEHNVQDNTLYKKCFFFWWFGISGPSHSPIIRIQRFCFNFPFMCFFFHWFFLLVFWNKTKHTCTFELATEICSLTSYDISLQKRHKPT